MKNKKIYLLIILLLVGIYSKSETKISPLPAVFQLQFNKTLFVSGEKIWFKNSMISAPDKVQQNILYVDLCGEGIVVTSRILLRENHHWQGELTIPDSLQTGIYLFRAYTGNSDGKPEIVSKLVTIINRFGNKTTNEIHKKNPVNKPFDFTLQLPADAGTALKTYANSTQYKTKEKVEFWIEKDKTELLSGISFSVFKIPDSLFHIQGNTGQKIDEDLVEYADVWGKKIYNKLTMSGRVVEKATKKPVADNIIIYSIPDSIPQLNYAITGTNGEFLFEVDDCYGKQDVIVQSLVKSEEYDITLFSNLLDPPLKIPFYIPDEIENCDFVKLSVQRALLQKAYQIENRLSELKPLFKYPFYGKTENIVIPARFIDLVDFEEIAKEILPLCKIKREKDKVSMRLFDPVTELFDDNPWVLVDGVPISDIKTLSPLNSPKIKKIEIQPEIRCYGGLLIEGVLSIITYNGKFEETQLPVNAVRTDFETFYQPCEYLGNLKLEDSNFADFRDVLYWNPSIQPFSDTFNFKIQCSYEKGSYIAMAQGIDNNGTIHRSVYKFSVK